MLFNLFSCKIDFKMIKSIMRVLIERENADVTDADMAMGWKLQFTPRTVVVREKKKTDVTWTKVRYNQATYKPT
jgi:hypothetical protein